MLNVQISGDAETAARIREKPSVIRDALLKKCFALTLQLQAKIQNDKLSGQVLNVVTGALRRSIAQSVSAEGEVVEGRVFSSGDVKYAAAHEFGFDGKEEVKAHTRTIKEAFGKAISPKEVFVRAFERHMVIPEKSFMLSSLNEMSTKIFDELTQTVKDASK